MLIAQIRTNSHQLHCETRHWKRPKEAWEEIVCTFCTSGIVVNILTTSSWVNLFNEGTVVKLGDLIIKLNKKRVEMQNQRARQSVP